MTVLVLTHRADLTADLVVLALEQMEVPVLRLNPGDTGRSVELDARFDNGRWYGRLAFKGRELALSDICSIYYRRPTTWTGPEGMSEAEAAWAAEEVRAGFGGVLMSLRQCRWINHPRLAMWASNKPIQLEAAARSGFEVPATTVTNNGSRAAQFATKHSPVVYKTLAGTPRVEGGAIYTTRTTADEIRTEAEAVSYALHQFQQEIPKRYEVRLTVVDGRMFAARIDAGSDPARLDWRRDYDSVRLSVIQVPAAVEQSVRRFMDHLELVFSTFDFIVDDQGRWIFLEANTNGQWGFVEQDTKLPIAAAIAEALTKGGTT
ncbi:ATP-grasp ribosomal peptide maturase [Glycomyces sp. NPDC046736]|uniref:ATP-grasp ribosomal peptide maturase n=1 Tax=Glycomyces sp. NPDC046736 TaxID=3155615 RepID=UPI0033CD6F6C